MIAAFGAALAMDLSLEHQGSVAADSTRLVLDQLLLHVSVVVVVVVVVAAVEAKMVVRLHYSAEIYQLECVDH